MIRRGIVRLFGLIVFLGFLLKSDPILAQQQIDPSITNSNYPSPQNVQLNKDQKTSGIQLSWQVSTKQALKLDTTLGSYKITFGSILVQYNNTPDIYAVDKHQTFTGNTINYTSNDNGTYVYPQNKKITINPDIFESSLEPDKLETIFKNKPTITFTLVDPTSTYDSFANNHTFIVRTGPQEGVDIAEQPPGFSLPGFTQKGGINPIETSNFSEDTFKTYQENKLLPYASNTKTTDATKKIIDLTAENTYNQNFKNTNSPALTSENSISNFKNFTALAEHLEAIKKLEHGDKNPFQLDTKVFSDADLNDLYNIYLRMSRSTQNDDQQIFNQEIVSFREDYKKIFGDNLVGSPWTAGLTGIGYAVFNSPVASCDDLIGKLSAVNAKNQAHIYGEGSIGQWVDNVLIGGVFTGTAVVLTGATGGSLWLGAAGGGLSQWLQETEKSNLSDDGKQKLKEFTLKSTKLQLGEKYLALGALAKGVKKFNELGSNLPQGIGLNPHKMLQLDTELSLLRDRFKDCASSVNNQLNTLKGKCDINIPVLGDAMCTISNIILGFSVSLANFSFNLLLKATTLI